MTEHHAITPPPELVKEWIEPSGYKVIPEWLHELLQTAAQWGADQELEACCEWLHHSGAILPMFIEQLRAARRPKPPSLAEEALELVTLIQGNKKMWQIEQLDVVRHALERLQELEEQQ